MFKKIKTSNMILAVIGIFVLLQCMTSLFYLYNSYNNKNSMSVINSSNEKVALLTNTWFAMNSVRSNINRVVVWIQNDGPEGEKTLASLQSAKDELKKTALWYDKFIQAGEIAGIDPSLTKNLDVSYKNFYASLGGLIAEADKKDPSALLNYNLTPSFNQMLADYDAWRSAANNMSTKNYVTSQNVFSQMIFGLILIMLIILAIVFLSWYAIKSTLITPLNKALEFIGLIAEGDLSRDIEIDEKSQNEMSRLFSGLKIMKDSIFSTVKTVRESSEIISQEIVKLVDGNNDLSSRTEQQAASLEETAASMEQITQTVTLNAENADQAATEASEAAGSAKMGGEVVSAVSEKIREMEVNAGKISEVTVLIKSIAFQTNILALNAAVEAARAGESGKGFAVVAGEVRNLAQNCANAARDVELLIKESSERVEKSSRLASAANKNIDGVVVSAQNLSHIINEISVASREQKSGISQVGIAITELDKVTQQNYGLVQEAAGSCISLKDQIAILHENVVKFRLY